MVFCRIGSFEKIRSCFVNYVYCRIGSQKPAPNLRVFYYLNLSFVLAGANFADNFHTCFIKNKIISKACLFTGCENGGLIVLQNLQPVLNV